MRSRSAYLTGAAAVLLLLAILYYGCSESLEATKVDNIVAEAPIINSREVTLRNDAKLGDAISFPESVAAEQRAEGVLFGGMKVGSEGYGPHIERAASGSNPDLWLLASQVTVRCNREAAFLDLLHARKGKRDADALATMIRESEAQIRLCQTVTQSHTDLALPLLKRAAAAGADGAGIVFAQLLGADATSADRHIMRQALESDLAREHQEAIVYLAIFGGPVLGVDAVRQRAYALFLDAHGTKESKEAVEAMKPARWWPFGATSLTAADEARAVELVAGFEAARQSKSSPLVNP
jgi:hypothetical protein